MAQKTVAELQVGSGDSGAAAAYTRGTAQLINDNGNFVCTGQFSGWFHWTFAADAQCCGVGTSQGVILIFKVGPNDATLDTQLDSHEVVASHNSAERM